MSFAVKFFFRLTHITCSSIVIGTIFADALWTIEKPNNYVLVQSVAGTLAMIAGFTNIFLLKTKGTMGEYHLTWKYLLYLKFALWFLFLPLPEYVFRKLGSEFPRKVFNQVLVTVFIIMSVYAKQLRDWATLQNLSKKES